MSASAIAERSEAPSTEHTNNFRQHFILSSSSCHLCQFFHKREQIRTAAGSREKFKAGMEP